jgi:hypothetical protein
VLEPLDSHGSSQTLSAIGGQDEPQRRLIRTFVIRTDGSVVERNAMKGVWSNEFSRLHMSPGNTIVVPEKILQPTAMRQVLDWTQMLSQLSICAVAAKSF